MKKGFTLVEIMVVIVILGILAAVGIPKLFGSIAKAKASEIPVAAGSYVRLQDVYLGEKTVLGSWGSIGYNAPGNGATDNFTYGGDCFNETDTKELQQGALGWKATSKVSLNDCPAQSSWGIMLSAGKENSVTYKYQADQINCTALVHAWGFGNISGDCSPSQGQGNNNGSGENNPNGEEIGNQGQQGPSQAELDAQKQEEEKKRAEESQKRQAAQNAVQAAKEAFTSCTGHTCSKEERDRLKEAWDNEKAKCKELYGNAVCGE